MINIFGNVVVQVECYFPSFDIYIIYKVVVSNPNFLNFHGVVTLTTEMGFQFPFAKRGEIFSIKSPARYYES